MNTDSRELPPYGYMEESIEALIKSRPIPEAWLALSGSNAGAQYYPWLKQLIDDLSSLLWPTYDPVHRKWTNTPNAALTDADFELFKILRRKLKENIRGMSKEATTHEEFFREEDDERIIFGHRYERYDPSLPVYLRETLTDTLWTGCDRKMGSTHFQVKAALQRPRAYQVALIQGRKFDHVWAKSGGSPAMISGHCLQGVTGGCSAWLMFGRQLDAVSVEVLKQFTVDIGDRRVFAGVHYASDNLSSWYTAFKLLPFVVERSSVAATMQFLWEAITTKSDVYAAIKAHVETHAGSPYRAVMDAMRDAATVKVTGNQAPALASHQAISPGANGDRMRPT